MFLMAKMSKVANICENDEFSDFDDDYQKYYDEFDAYSRYEITPFSRWYYGKIADDTSKVPEPDVYDSYYDFQFEKDPESDDDVV